MTQKYEWEKKQNNIPSIKWSQFVAWYQVQMRFFTCANSLVDSEQECDLIVSWAMDIEQIKKTVHTVSESKYLCYSAIPVIMRRFINRLHAILGNS